MTKSLGDAVWKALDNYPMSVSHDKWHIERVVAFATALHAKHGGDLDALTAAAIMHDLGRSDEKRPHGLPSIEASTEVAAEILRGLNCSEQLTRQILCAISEHDQPDLRPSSIEGRILKDADFLAGIGAWGVLRIAMWSGEMRRNIDEVMDRLERGMTRRVETLEFPESIVLAERELLFAQLFTSRLHMPAVLPEASGGPYIVLEGISGSGKDTQARQLVSRLQADGIHCLVVSEPHGDYKVYKSAWTRRHHEKSLTDTALMKWLMIADRQQLMDATVRPALHQGITVISVRSFLSTMVYQATSTQDEAQIAFEHSFVPRVSALILLDVPGDVAWQRISKRDKEKGVHETVEQLTDHRRRYLTLATKYFRSRSHVVDGTQSSSRITHEIVELALKEIRTDPSRSREE